MKDGGKILGGATDTHIRVADKIMEHGGSFRIKLKNKIKLGLN